jgi:hypothetical protein
MFPLDDHEAVAEPVDCSAERATYGEICVHRTSLAASRRAGEIEKYPTIWGLLAVDTAAGRS